MIWVWWLSITSHIINVNPLSWNCQVVGRPRKISNVRELIGVHRSTVVILMETKNKEQKLERIRKRTSMAHSYYSNPDGYSGGLALWWLDLVDLNVSIVHHHHHLSSATISSHEADLKLEDLFIYGSNNM